MQANNNRDPERMLGADTQELVEELYPKGKEVLLMTKGGKGDSSLKTATREHLDAVLPGETIRNVGVTMGHILAMVQDLRADFESNQVGIILAESGSESRKAGRVASELREHGEGGAVAKKVPFVVLRNSPSPGHQNVDYGDEANYRNGLFDAVIATPLDIEDVRIAIIEALLKVEGTFEALNLAARERMLVQFEAMHQRLGVAYEAFLKQFEREPEVASIRENFAAINEALPNIRNDEAETRKTALKEVRLNTEAMLSRLSRLRDRFERNKVDTKLYADGPAAAALFTKLENLIKRLWTVGIKMRAANDGYSSFSWYKALKTFGKEAELTEYLNSRHAVKMLFDQCSILEEWAQQVEGFEVNARQVDPKDKAATDAKEFFSNFASGLWNVHEFAGAAKAQLLNMNVGEFSHQLNNQVSPLLSSMAIYNGEGAAELDDGRYKAALNEDERLVFETLLANVQKFSDLVQMAKENLKKGGNWDEFLKKLAETASSYA